jgi:hypothetical protein
MYKSVEYSLSFNYLGLSAFQYFSGHGYDPPVVQYNVDRDEYPQKNTRPVMNIAHQCQWHNDPRQTQHVHECSEFKDPRNKTDKKYYPHREIQTISDYLHIHGNNRIRGIDI